MTDVILVLNAGSSSLKFALYPLDEADAAPLMRGNISGIGNAPHFSVDHRNPNNKTYNNTPDLSRSKDYGEILNQLLDWISQGASSYIIRAAAHRIVHGGQDFTGPVIITPKILSEIAELIPLAPLHQAAAIAVIKAVSKKLADIPQIACFDTSFHMTRPRIEKLFALPRDLTTQGIMRYGFHGLSYDYIAGELPGHLGPRATDRIIVAHLGNGASLCALRDLKSVATTMSFTALDGLMMGTRCGALDPGVLLYLLQQKDMSPEAINQLLYNKSGLLGVSELSADVRVLERSDDPRAKEALDLFTYRAILEIGALTAALGGLDALIFTAGIGENSATMRQKTCEKLAWLGADLDTKANGRNQIRISSNTSEIDILVIPTNEELMLARDARETLNAA